MAKFSPGDEGGLVSLELDDEDKIDTAVPDLAQPDFPWGTRITLTTPELQKLGIDVKDAKVGDYFYIYAKACVTSISSSDGPSGPCDRLEAQIEEMSVPDMDDDETGDGY